MSSLNNWSKIMIKMFVISHQIWKCVTRPSTQEENMEIRQMTLFFSSTVPVVTACNIHIWIWKYLKFIFMWSPSWSILVCNTSISSQKLSIRAAHHKNLHYVLSTHQSQIPILLGSSSWTMGLSFSVKKHL